MRSIIFTVTTELSYDQRMQRIAGSMSASGYDVLLVGRETKTSIPLISASYTQKRISCFFNQGFGFYAEFNIRLFFFLLFNKADIFCAIDLDTILPVYFVSLLKSKERVYDAHEYFTEQKEILTRPKVYAFWLAIEKFAIPKFRNGYTVNQSIAAAFRAKYGVDYALVRNLPKQTLIITQEKRTEKFFLYQGSVNEGRSFETLIPAMKLVNARLIICGKGNFYDQVVELIKTHGLENKIELRGYVAPAELRNITPTAYAGITLFDREGMNQYYSLANRFFDYMMAGIPQICVNYPEYAALNQNHPFALLINDVKPDTIAQALNNLLEDDVLYEGLQENCLKARTELNWEKEEKTLLNFYSAL